MDDNQLRRVPFHGAALFYRNAIGVEQGVGLPISKLRFIIKMTPAATPSGTLEPGSVFR